MDIHINVYVYDLISILMIRSVCIYMYVHTHTQVVESFGGVMYVYEYIHVAKMFCTLMHEPVN